MTKFQVAVNDKKKTPKRVLFSDECSSSSSLASVIPCAHPPLVRDADNEALWFTRRELDNILQECREKLAASSSIALESDCSLRGLELVACRYSGNDSCLKQRQEWIRSVLQQQKPGEPLVLSQCTRQTCELRQRVAHLRGLQDAQVVHGPNVLLGQQSSSKSTELLVASKHADIRDRRRTKRHERRDHTELVVARTA